MSSKFHIIIMISFRLFLAQTIRRWPSSPFPLKTTCGPKWRSGAAEYSVVYAAKCSFDKASEGSYWRNYTNGVEDKTRRGLSARILLRSLDLVVAADGPMCGDTAASAAYRATVYHPCSFRFYRYGR